MHCTKSSYRWNDGQWTFAFIAESESARAANLPSDGPGGGGGMTIMFYVASETDDVIMPEPLKLQWRVEEYMELAQPENSDIWLDIMALFDCMPSFPNDAREKLKSQMSSDASEFMRIVSRCNHQTVMMRLEIKLCIHSSVDALPQELRTAVLDFNNSYGYVETSNEDAADDDEGHDDANLRMLAVVIEKNVKFEELRGLEDARKICTVCQEELKTGVVTGQMPCKHVFHKECIKKWMLRSNNCPVCRFKLPDT